MPIPAFKGISMYSSGYEFYEKIALAESIKIIGANYEFEPYKIFTNIIVKTIVRVFL